MAKICSLFSGSSGNCTFIGSGKGGILIDAGVSARRICAALAQRQIDPACLQALFVTHEHDDHIAGVRVLAGQYHLPVFATEGTLLAMERKGALSDKVDAYILDLPQIAVGDMGVSLFRTPHDAAESCGYRVALPTGQTVAVCTDLGFVTAGVRQGIGGCDAVVIESNHDVDMLKTGSYPRYLKDRILGRLGHLSNDACAAELPALVEQGATRLILGHVSRENNLPALAERTALQTLAQCGMQRDRDFVLAVASPTGCETVLL